MSGIQDSVVPPLEEVTKHVRLTKNQKEMLNQFWPETHRFLSQEELDKLKQKGIVYQHCIVPLSQSERQCIPSGNDVPIIPTIKNEEDECKEGQKYSTLIDDNGSNV